MEKSGSASVIHGTREDDATALYSSAVKVFLLWRDDGDAETSRVAENLRKRFAPLLATPPEVTIRRSPAASLVILDVPLRGWNRPFFEEDECGWVQAIDYPIEATSLIAARDHLDLAHLSPPFLLIHSDNESLHVRNDGLGQAQLFEYDDGTTWALTNKITALQALGITLKPVPHEWAVHATLGAFPSDLTGYASLRRVGPATHFRIDRDRVHRTTQDILGEWLHASNGDPFERARTSLIDRAKSAASGWNEASAGLTGGWDTRAIVASLRAAGVAFQARVKGRSESSDVMIARELASVADLPLRVEEAAEVPSMDVEDWRRSIALALVWQAGDMDIDKHKTIFANGAHLPHGFVNVMGQHGEIARAYHYGNLMRKYPGRAVPWTDPELDELSASVMLTRQPTHLRAEWSGVVRDVLLDAIREADRYDLHGVARLDFFYLYQNTRRYNAGSLASQTNFVVTPFLNPDFIRAAFAAKPSDKADFALHRYIVEKNAPEWSAIEYATPGSYYDSDAAWQTAGAALLDDAIDDGGFWTEVFDANATREQLASTADEIAMLSMLPGYTGSPAAR